MNVNNCYVCGGRTEVKAHLQPKNGWYISCEGGCYMKYGLIRRPDLEKGLPHKDFVGLSKKSMLIKEYNSHVRIIHSHPHII